MTYHGPGQQVMYVLLNLKRRKLGVRDLVTLLEQTVVNTLAEIGIEAHPRADARASTWVKRKSARWVYVSVAAAHSTV